MAMPLEPTSGFFPDTLVSPFIVALEVRDLASDVLASFDEFRDIREAIAEQGLRIRYVFETKPYDPTKEEVKPHTIAKVTKAGPLWRLLAETELVIQFRQWFWDSFTEQERRGVLHHELTHIEVGEPTEDGSPKVSLREHDVEEFAQTALRFGPRRDSHQQLFRAFLAWERTQQPPEPRKLRPVKPGDLGDAIVDAAAAGGAHMLQETADRLGGDISIEANGRKVTISPRSGEADLRPTGEVNVDELRGEAARSSEPDDLSDLDELPF